ncbi:MAG: FAD-dependent monooxygenase [Actinomycetaceae bacterium]|nr:FAD-dependent monooxygenase [Actinomycetaceae bacterium]
MQFHHHGYVSENPRVLPSPGQTVDSASVPETADVLIIGAGPAGMITAAQLAMFPDIRTVLVERRPHRLILGHADGIAARSVETFQAFGFAPQIIQEAYQITETAFWKADPNKPENIVRAKVTADDPTGISEFPHLIVNQARVLDYFAEFAQRAPARLEPHYGWETTSLEIAEGDYPVVATVKNAEGVERVIRAKYALGADGAHSLVRKAIGAQHLGGISNHAWGVADVLATTDFPDIRTKCIIHSSKGSILHIPREGGYLFRTYVDLGEVPEGDDGQVRKTPLEEILRKCNAIMAPYSIDVKNVAWWSVYEVGHRVTDRFDDVPTAEVGTRTPRVFIAGDACHTHSAKAGQGMNVSMQDGFNLAWKLAQVLRSQSPESLLETYTAERQAIAQDLIDFDREWSYRMADAGSTRGSAESIEDFYVSTWEFPAGFGTHYKPSVLTGAGTHQDLATGFPVGRRFKSYGVVRRSDAVPKHLGHLAEADGRWRLYAFADKAPAGDAGSKLAQWGQWLGSEAGPLKRYTAAGADVNSLFDVKVIYQQGVHDFEITDVPEVFKPANGPFALNNWENVFAVDTADDIFEGRGVSRDGVVVVVRPDQYVAHVLPLDATEELSKFFEGIFLPQN